MEDDAVIARPREDQTPFTGIFTTSRRSWRSRRRFSIEATIDAVLNIILVSDDPGMFPTSSAKSTGLPWMSWVWLRRSALAGVDACWLPDAEKAALKESMTVEIEALEQGLFG